MKIEVHEDAPGEFDSCCPQDLEEALHKAASKIVRHRAGQAKHPKDGTVHALTQLTDHMVSVYQESFPDIMKSVLAAVRESHGDEA